MKRALLATVVLTLTAGCKEPGDASPGASTQAPAPTASVAPEPVFRGTYRAAWGDTVFTQAGKVVVASYPGGSIDCMASGEVLDCTWKEGGSGGKARLTRQASGTLQGTWGNAADDHDGGQWTFVPK